MEAVAAIAVIAAVLLLLGFKASTLAFIGLAVLGLLFMLVTLLFVYFFIRMLFAGRKQAEFTRIDKSPRSPFKVAYYMVDGTEYPCVFPEEGFLENKLYKSGKNYRVLLDRRKKYVYDRFAIATCTIGFFFSTAFSAATVLFILNIK